MAELETPGLIPGLTPCHWGSVNQWECDENDHLNVRFYAHKVNQALQVFVNRLTGLPCEQVAARIVSQHIRFIRESRAATPLRVDCGLADAPGDGLDVLSLMHDNVTGEPVAAFRTRLDVDGAAAADVVAPPAFAAPRGIDPADLLTPPEGLEAARAMGFHIVGRGVLAADECGPDGRALPHVYVGRISDGMPNLWAFLNPPAERSARASGAQGGAALEQRLTILAPLARGSVFTQLSGVRALGNKTQHMVHLLHDDTHGRMAASMEAVGVAMDLETRKAVPISDERRRHLEKLLLG